jgi:hypothetical protein
MTKKYGGYTLEQLEQMVLDSNETQTSIDDLCGGDQAASCLIIEDLLARIRDLEMYEAQALKASGPPGWTEI